MITIDQFKPEEKIWDDARLVHEISEIMSSQNPFYLPFKGDDRKHFILNTRLEGKWDEQDCEWEDMDQHIEFRMTTYGTPTIEDFSKHIQTELKACIEAMKIEWWNERLERFQFTNDSMFIFNWNEIKSENVYRFMKALHKDYSKTDDFMRDYDHYESRLYHSLKWAWSMSVGKNYMFSETFKGHIGLYNLLCFIFQDEVEIVE